MLAQPRTWMVLLLAAAVALTACARSPEARKARHLARGDGYFERQRYEEAVIEYTNVLRLDRASIHAMRRLALAHWELGQFAQAYPHLLRWRDASPEAAEARLKLAAVYLLARQPDHARQEASAVLARDPDNLEATLLLAGSTRSEDETDEAIRRLEDLRVRFAGEPKLHMARGALYLRRRDEANAERAFLEAVARAPRSMEARSALGDFYAAHRRPDRAEQEYRAAVELGPVGSTARLRLADFYLALQRLDDGKRVLREVTEKAPEYLPAWRRLAEVAFAERKYDESLRALEPVFKKNPSDVDGRLLRGRVHLARGESTEAIQEFRRVLSIEPGFVAARYHLALAQLATGNIQQAKIELAEAINLAPTFTDAALLLAELHVNAGSVDPAIEVLDKLLSRQPRDVRALVLLGSAHLAKRHPAEAVEVYRKIVALVPKDPRGHHLVGLALRTQGRVPEARKAFEDALALAPEYIDPLVQLIGIAMANKTPAEALSRVQRQLAVAPRSPGLTYVLGRVHHVRGEMDAAERAYLAALQFSPEMVSAYVALGQIYARSARYDQALVKLHEAIKRNPKDAVAQMLLGVVHERKGDVASAVKTYEKVLELNPRFAAAANNLAYLYSEHLGDKERALQLAQLAKESAPDEPHISDTLGWILYKRGVFQLALALLKESASKLPDNLEIQYHLGMTYARVGDKDNARRALTRAVASAAPFPGKDDARRALQAL